jgi:oligopeptide/dipeptide ABC transporter ATP-binding protein
LTDAAEALGRPRRGVAAVPDHRAPLASVDDLKIYFRTKAGLVHAVDGLRFEIYDGEALGLVGETGCGKTITARSFLRLVPTPPGVYAGGRVQFRPRKRCEVCGGAGCEDCGGVGRVPTPCSRCGGGGCRECDMSGEETVDLLRIPERRLRDIRGNRIAMIFQDPSKALNPALPVREQIAEVLYVHRSDELLRRAGIGSETGVLAPLMSRMAEHRSSRPERIVLRFPPLRALSKRLRAAVAEWVAESLAETRIANPRKVMNSFPHELSGGMKQRVMIAQALACDPDLLIADEPTTALDVTIQARILELIRELQDRHRSSVLYISHDLALVNQVCDRVAVMYAGRVVECGASDAIFRDPLHPYTRGLLAAIPTSTDQRGRLMAIEGTVPELIDPKPACRFHPRCPHAAPVCRSIDPPLHAHADDDRPVACFLYERAEEFGVEPSRMPTWAVRR